MLVTPTPLEGVQITDKAQKLTEAQVGDGKRTWGTSVGRLEMATQGQAWTKEEKDAQHEGVDRQRARAPTSLLSPERQADRTDVREAATSYAYPQKR